MAGVGSRLESAARNLPKPLVPIGGRPLISYALEAFARAGVQRLHIIVGANGETLAEKIRPLAEPQMKLHAIANPDWKKQNGVSVLKAAGIVTAPFFLAMADHLFEPAILETLRERSDPTRLNLAVDRKIAATFDLDDAMKVQTAGDEVAAISKTLPDYNAIDTGLFVCPNELFDYLRAAQREGDCSLADGVRLMAAERKVKAIDIGDAWWQDVDTPEMLARAEAESARLFRHDRGRTPEKRVRCEH